MKHNTKAVYSRQESHNRPQPTISCVMIVKNEEECLERCLKSVRDVVDEIVVVDTGSTDRTVEIAERFGARIFHHPWENDFSKHRNQSLSYATGDWLFQIDADEELFTEDGLKLREIVRLGAADYYHCRFYDIREDGSVHGVFNLIRLFRNGMGMTFTQKVHNQLQTKGTGAFCTIRFRHYGYHLSREKMEAKHVRTTTLLNEMLAENPADAYSRHQLASSYSMHREFAAAVQHGEMALALRRQKSLQEDFFVTTFYTVAQAYFALERLDDAERICREALEFFPSHLDICHLLAAIYFKQRKADACRAISERYLSIYKILEDDPAALGDFYCQSLAKRYEILFGLACITFGDRDESGAAALFRQAFEDSGQRLDIGEKICLFYRNQSRKKEIANWLTVLHETGLSKGEVSASLADDRALYLSIGQRYLEQGQWAKANDCLEMADDKYLNEEDRMAKILCQLLIYWRAAQPEGMLSPLGALMIHLGMDTNRCLDSLEDLGRIIYDLAEAFGLRQQWHPAQQALALAVEIAPALFDRTRFEELLQPPHA